MQNILEINKNNPRCDVHIYQKTKCSSMFVTTIFRGHSVFSPLYTTTLYINTKKGEGENDYNSYKHVSDNQ
jgi:hypothetical protein